MVLDVKTTDQPAKHMKILQDFKQKIEYFVEDGKCHKIPTPYPCLYAHVFLVRHSPLGTQEGSKKVSSFYYGSPTSPLYVDLYMIPAGKIFGLSGFLTVTRDGCIPVGEGLHGIVGKTSEMISIGFSNYTKGIKDPRVFNVPSECKNAKFNPMAKDPVHRIRRSVFH